MPTPDLAWPSPPENPAPAGGVVDVWAIPLDQPSHHVAAHASSLSAPERKRAATMRYEKDRNRFIVGRGVLRAVLGGYLKLAPHQLEFRYGPCGKPELSAPHANCAVQFNLAHSDCLALCAVTRAGPVGIDVEQVRPMGDEQALADRFFTRRESEALNHLPDSRKIDAFFKLWTRKEAWLKATGEGIAEALAEVEMTFHPDEPARILKIRGSESAAAAWSLVDLTPAKGFMAAVACNHGDLKIRRWAWRE